jgi:uncharacterized membrane protein YqjE
MTSVPTEQARLGDASTRELVSRLLADVREIVDGEVQLAKLELTEKRSRLQEAGGLMAAGAVVAIFAIGVFVAAAVLALSLAVPAWAASLIVGVLLVTVALVLFFRGRAKMRSVGTLAPTEAIEATREDMAWMRREIERLRSTE